MSTSNSTDKIKKILKRPENQAYMKKKSLELTQEVYNKMFSEVFTLLGMYNEALFNNQKDKADSLKEEIKVLLNNISKFVEINKL